MKKSIILLIFFTTIVLFSLIYYFEGNLPVNRKDHTSKIFVIDRGEGVNSIVKRLHNEGLIRNRIVFYLLVKQMHIADNIQAGDFRLSPSMGAKEIAKTLTKGTLDVWVTVIEGLRKEEVAQLISKNFSIPESEFVSEASEGYLFPDTYLIPREATSGAILNIFMNNFAKRYDETLQAKAHEKGFSELQVLTLASLVEKEAKKDPDRQQIASIILKRWKQGWPLQIDATVQYAHGYQPLQKTWWKKNLTNQDLKIVSLYNTYLHPGLPLGPICSPGLASIKAVLDANAQTPYWFYISSKDGATMHYARTAEEHAENIQKYLR